MLIERRRSWRHLWLGLLLLALLTLAQGSGRLRFGPARVGPDLVLCAVIAWGFLTDSVHGASWGFAGGLMLDSISTVPFPLNTLALTLAGAIVGSGRLSAYADEVGWAFAAAAVGCAVFYGVTWVGLSLKGWAPPALSALRYVVLPCIVLDVFGVLLMLPFLRLVRRGLGDGRMAV